MRTCKLNLFLCYEKLVLKKGLKILIGIHINHKQIWCTDFTKFDRYDLFFSFIIACRIDAKNIACRIDAKIQSLKLPKAKS